MATHLITGYAGKNHIKSVNQASFNAAFMGNGEYVMKRKNEFAASILTNTKVRIDDGDIIMQGRHIEIETDTYEEMLIDTGAQGYNRNDLIVMTYEKDPTTLVETAYLEVLTGTASESTATDPQYVHGDILDGSDVKNQMPLYRVRVSGINITAVEKLFQTVDSFRSLNDTVHEEFEEHLVEWDAEVQAVVGNVTELVDAEAQIRANADTAINNKIGTKGTYKTIYVGEITSSSGSILRNRWVCDTALSENTLVVASLTGYGYSDNGSRMAFSEGYIYKVTGIRKDPYENKWTFAAATKVVPTTVYDEIDLLNKILTAKKEELERIEYFSDGVEHAFSLGVYNACIVLAFMQNIGPVAAFVTMTGATPHVRAIANGQEINMFTATYETDLNRLTLAGAGGNSWTGLVVKS